MGTTIPPRATTTGSASRRRSRNSPMSNSRRASRPATRKRTTSARSSPSPASYRPVPRGRTGSSAPGATSPHTGRVDVGPGQRRQRGGTQDHRAASLRAQEPARRRLQIVRPPGAPRKPPRGDAGGSVTGGFSRAPLHQAIGAVNRQPLAGGLPESHPGPGLTFTAAGWLVHPVLAGQAGYGPVSDEPRPFGKRPFAPNGQGACRGVASSQTPRKVSKVGLDGLART